MRKTTSSTTRGRVLATAAVIGLVALGGCMTLEEMAPPMQPAVVAAADSLGHDAAAVARGRRIYLTACIECHAVQPIAEHSLDEWSEILVEMSAESELSASEQADLTAYVETAHRFLTSLGSAEN